MKKTAIASVAFAVALFSTSCQKEATLEQRTSGPMTISAVAEGLGTPTKTEMIFKYDIAWSQNDKIYVVDGQGNHDTFTLQNGAGTTKGTFKQDGTISLNDKVQAYYPATMLEGGSPVWPASQTNDQTIPMYCKKTLSGTTEESMDFSSLGSVLQIVFNTTQENVTLKSIEIKDGSATLSGAFTVDTDGKAVITATDKAGITLDLGTGVALGKAANYFNIAIPAGDYQDLTLIFTTDNGRKCTMTGGKVNISRNTVGRLTLTGEKFEILPVESVGLDKSTAELHVGENATLVATVLPVNASDKSVSWTSSNPDVATVDATGKVTAVAVGTATITVTTTDGGKTATCTVTVKAALPADALPGEFSVSATKKVHFSKGNLWADGDNALHFEASQNAFNSSYESSHVSHFTWSSTVAAAVGTSISGSNLFCDEANKQSIDGSDKIYYALSQDEWTYLFYNHSTKWATVNGVGGFVIAPDDFVGTLEETYANDTELADAGNLVFLPAAGLREGPNVNDVGGGSYWSSTASDGGLAYYVYFKSSYDIPYIIEQPASIGFSVRLIIDAPADTKGTAMATINDSKVDVNWVQLWAGGPKFAEYNVGATSATEIGTSMKFTDATKASSQYVWGRNWCTPSKADMEHLMTAAKGETDDEVRCEYTQEGSTYGFKFTGKKPGYTENSVFFPTKYGYIDYGNVRYWSGSDSGGKAWGMTLSYDYEEGGWLSEWEAVDKTSKNFVRPVLKN